MSARRIREIEHGPRLDKAGTGWDPSPPPTAVALATTITQAVGPSHKLCMPPVCLSKELGSAPNKAPERLTQLIWLPLLFLVVVFLVVVPFLVVALPPLVLRATMLCGERQGRGRGGEHRAPWAAERPWHCRGPRGPHNRRLGIVSGRCRRQGGAETQAATHQARGGEDLHGDETRGGPAAARGPA